MKKKNKSNIKYESHDLWNNRIFKRCLLGKDGKEHTYYEMRETYYIHDPVRRIFAHDVSALQLSYFENPDELIQSLARLLSDAIKHKEDIIDLDNLEIKPINEEDEDEDEQEEERLVQ